MKTVILMLIITSLIVASPIGVPFLKRKGKKSDQTPIIEPRKKDIACLSCCFFRTDWRSGLEAKDGTQATCYDGIVPDETMQYTTNICADNGILGDDLPDGTSSCEGYGIWRSRVVSKSINSWGIIVGQK
jgi:hypothetical protein